MSIDAQTFQVLLAARDGFAAHETPLSVAILGDCAFTIEWATGDNRRDLAEFARRMNLSRVETLDLGGNPTIRTDITAALPPELEGAFDLVLDIGTLYWCFDVAAGWRNCLTMLKQRGLIAHHSALTGYFGRGYYTFPPRLFRDVYAANGFFDLQVMVRARKFFPEAGLWRRLLLRLSKPSAAFRGIAKDAIFLNRADWRGFKFGSDAEPQAPMLPNDAEILCLARREAAIPFTAPRQPGGL